MNIEKGASALEELSRDDALQVPAGFRTFTGDNLPDFSALYSGPFTVKVGRGHQGWQNGTLADMLYREQMLVSDNVAPERTVTGRYNLSPADVPSFLEEACRRLSPAEYWPVKVRDLVGVSYLSWDPTKGSDNKHVKETFFVGTHDGRLFLQYGEGHYDGWDLPVTITEIGLSDEPGLHREIGRSVTEARDFVEQESEGDVKNVIMEGLVMRGGYPVQGPMFIDLYALPTGTLPDTLGHRAVLERWKEENAALTRILTK